jgi:hypothetical protein
LEAHPLSWFAFVVVSFPVFSRRGQTRSEPAPGLLDSFLYHQSFDILHGVVCLLQWLLHPLVFPMTAASDWWWASSAYCFAVAAAMNPVIYLETPEL